MTIIFSQIAFILLLISSPAMMRFIKIPLLGTTLLKYCFSLGGTLFFIGVFHSALAVLGIWNQKWILLTWVVIAIFAFLELYKKREYLFHKMSIINFKLFKEFMKDTEVVNYIWIFFTIILAWFLLFAVQMSPYIGGDSSAAYIGLVKQMVKEWRLYPENYPYSYRVPQYASKFGHVIIAHFYYLFGSMGANVFIFNLQLLSLVFFWFGLRNVLNKNMLCLGLIFCFTSNTFMSRTVEANFDSLILFFSSGCLFFFMRALNYNNNLIKKSFFLIIFFASSLASIKVNGLIILMVITLISFFLVLRKNTLLIFFIIPIFISIPWYLVSYFNTGNPFWPYFNQFFNLPEDYISPYFNHFNLNLIHSSFSFVLTLIDGFGADNKVSPVIPLTIPLIILLASKENIKLLKLFSMAIIGLFICYNYHTGFRHYYVFCVLLLFVLSGVIGIAVDKMILPRRAFKLLLFTLVFFLIGKTILFSIQLLPLPLHLERYNHFYSRLYLMSNYSFGLTLLRYTGHLPYQKEICFMLPTSTYDKLYYTVPEHLTENECKYWISETKLKGKTQIAKKNNLFIWKE